MAPRRSRVVFMGSPDFAVPTLEALHASDRFEVSLVVTRPEKPVGRGRRAVPTPVKRLATSAGLPLLEVERSDYAVLSRRVSDLGPDFIVVVAFGLILKKDLLEAPRMGCINLHASLLPRYRGVSPVAAAILGGDSVTGCTTILMDEGIDTGDILLTVEEEIRPDDTTGTLSERLSIEGAVLVERTLLGLLDGTLVPRKQDDAHASYTKKLKKADGEIDWTKRADFLERFVRAMQPWPTAYTFFRDRRVVLLKSAVRVGAGGREEPGTIVSTRPLVVACGTGLLEVVELKVEGRKPVGSDAFVNGYRVERGALFGSGA